MYHHYYNTRTTVLKRSNNFGYDRIEEAINFSQFYRLTSSHVTWDRLASTYTINGIRLNGIAGSNAQVDFFWNLGVISTGTMASYKESLIYADFVNSRENTLRYHIFRPVSSRLTHTVFLNSYYESPAVNWKYTRNF